MLARDMSALSELSHGGLQSAVRHCVERARPRAAQLLRVVARLPEHDPWALLGCPGYDRGVALAWQDARRGSVFAAWGVAAEVTTSGPSRIRRGTLEAAALAERTICVDPRGAGVDDGELPLLCGGFAFGPRGGSANASRPWRSWPAGWLFVPRTLVHRTRDGATTLVLSEPIEHGEPAEAVMQRVAARLRSHPALDGNRHIPAEPGCTLKTDPRELQCWLSAVSRARSTISRGALQKVVLARSVALSRPGRTFDPIGTLLRLRERYGATSDGCTLYALRRPDGATFLGATPETLIDLSGTRLQTLALAGTAARDPDPARDAAAANTLANSVKEQQEHGFVVGAIVDALRHRCAELHVDDAPRVRQLRAVQHLETIVSGRLATPTHVLQLVDALHPTPAVGGWPSAEALAWIEANEQLERGWYAGPLGWLTRGGDGHFVVSLRCALVDQDTAWAFAGAGLTEGSQPATEWSETTLKLRTIADALVSASTQGPPRGGNGTAEPPR